MIHLQTIFSGISHCKACWDPGWSIQVPLTSKFTRVWGMEGLPRLIHDALFAVWNITNWNPSSGKILHSVECYRVEPSFNYLCCMIAGREETWQAHAPFSEGTSLSSQSVPLNWFNFCVTPNFCAWKKAHFHWWKLHEITTYYNVSHRLVETKSAGTPLYVGIAKNHRL